MGAGVVGCGGGWWRWRCEIRRPVDESTEKAGSLRRRRLHRRRRPGEAGSLRRCQLLRRRCPGCRRPDESTEKAGSLWQCQWLRRRCPGGRRPVPRDGGGSFLRPASPGQAVARSLLLVVLDSLLARWRRFCQCMLECFLYHGSISQVSQDFSPPFPHVDPRRQQFVCHHSSSSVGLGIWMWAPSSSVFPTSSFHARFVVRVELTLLRFNDELRGLLLLSPVMPPQNLRLSSKPPFCAVFVEATGWGLPVCQACCTPKEAQGCIRRGIAAAPC
ncbi:hypothetical protein EE612_003546 [Oryza sativa]|nr:hypothetical protein EE612_003546 [Oryza sativa]